MRSTLGRRAEICKELGWSLEFVEHGISWAKLQMVVMDMPRITGNGDKKKRTELTEDNADELMPILLAGGAVLEE